MSQTNDVVISDASCLIALERIDMLSILAQLFGKIIITKEVAAEYGNELPEWIEVRTVIHQDTFREFRLKLDLGEASAIALALETPNAVLVIDEYKGRKEAFRVGLRIMGTAGVLLMAKETGLIPLVKPYLEQLKKVEFRLSDALLKKTLENAGE